MTLKTDTTITENPAISSETPLDAKLRVFSKSYPKDWRKRVEKIVGGMREYNINLGEDRSPESLLARHAALVNLDRNIIELETRLDQLRDERKQQRLELWQLALSARQAALGLYGPDSMQYQALGGTRASERKSPNRKPKD